jgi:hypothetical protein
MLTWQYFLARSNLPLLRYTCHTSLEEKKNTEKLLDMEDHVFVSTCTFSVTFGNCKSYGSSVNLSRPEEKEGEKTDVTLVAVVLR